jgi:hypothetical protein
VDAYWFTFHVRIFHLCIAGGGLQNFGLGSALRVFESRSWKDPTCMPSVIQKQFLRAHPKDLFIPCHLRLGRGPGRLIDRFQRNQNCKPATNIAFCT